MGKKQCISDPQLSELTREKNIQVCLEGNSKLNIPARFFDQNRCKNKDQDGFRMLS